VLRQALTGGQVINLIGKTTLQDLPTLLRAADLFVGNDSGPKHIAAAIGVPTIGIHSGAVDAGEWGAVGARALTISRETVCSPCYLSKLSSCHRNQACLTGIGVGDVFAACQRMLILAGKHP
jgi:ADP-heptose:LPS heptosyltransferase